MDTPTLCKVLDADGRSLHGGNLQWSLPTPDASGAWEPGAWHEVAGAIVACKNGLHLTDERGVWQTWIRWDAAAWEAEADGDRDGSLDDGDRKIAVRRARLLRPLPDPAWWADAKAFVAGIPRVRWFARHDEIGAAWRVHPSRPSTRDAAWGAAGDAAGDAAWDSAWAAAGDAAWDAKLAAFARVSLAPDDPHRLHAEARWRVWEAGYGLAGVVDGTFHVYERP